MHITLLKQLRDTSKNHIQIPASIAGGCIYNEGNRNPKKGICLYNERNRKYKTNHPIRQMLRHYAPRRFPCEASSNTHLLAFPWDD